MGMVYSLTEMQPPTDVTAVAIDGGSLEPDTTYYYRLFTWKPGVFVLSACSPEVSATTTDAKRSIQLDFTATVSSNKVYFVLRTTTSGDYACSAPHAFTESTGGQSRRLIYWENVTQIVDDGSYSLNYHPYYPDGHPEIKIYADSDGETVTLEDIYQADKTNGWGLVSKGGNEMDESVTNSWQGNNQTGTYIVNADLRFGVSGNHNYTFRMKEENLVVYGIFDTDSQTYITWHFGTRSGTDVAAGPIITIFNPNGTLRKPNNDGGWWPYNTLQAIKKWYGVTLRQGNQSVRMPWGGGNNYLYETASDEFYKCHFAGYVQWRSTAAATYTRCLWHYRELTRTDITYDHNIFYGYQGIEYGALGYRLAGAAIELDSPTTQDSISDLYWGYHTSETDRVHVIIDGTFQSHGQTDNDPYHYILYRLANSIHLFMRFKFRLSLKVVDVNKQPIIGASVKIVDLEENEVSGSPFTTDSNGDISTTILDGRKLRIKWGEPTEWGYSTTSQGYEDTLVAAGDILERTYYTPHTITISKAGYITKRIKLDMDRKREQVVVLEKVKDLNFSRKAKIITQ